MAVTSGHAAADFDHDAGRMQERVVNQAMMHGVFHSGPMLFTERRGCFDSNVKIVDASGVLQFFGSDADAGTFRCQFVFPQILRGVETGT